MSKIEVNAAAEIIKKNHVEPEKLRAIVEEMNIVTQADDDGEVTPHVKKQFVIVVRDPEGTLPKNDYVGWVVQIEESESVATTKDRIFKGVYDFNASKKGRLLPVKTVGEAMENVPAKFFKEYGFWTKTKVPVLVVKTDNQIPREEGAS